MVAWCRDTFLTRNDGSKRCRSSCGLKDGDVQFSEGIYYLFVGILIVKMCVIKLKGMSKCCSKIGVDD